jgi:hypothetical protein
MIGPIVRRSSSLFLAVALLVGCKKDETPPAVVVPQPQVFSAFASIQSTLDAFRQAFGGVDNGGVPGTQPSGRREINWDAVPDSLAAPFNLPSNYFNAATTPRARGAVFSTPGTAIQVSADGSNPSGAAVRFGNINPTYSAIFRTFSPERLFSPIGSNIVDLTFFVPGTTTRAVVRGFGAVYTDIDQVTNTSFEYFDVAGNSLGQYNAAVSNNDISFLGVVFPTASVHRVRIRYGNSALGPDDGGSIDVAVMDDFIYGEPQASP